MRFILFYVFLIVVLSSCAPIKRHQRLVEKYPFVHTQDSVIIRDTFRIEIPKVRVDSVFNIELLRDTLIIEKERLRIKLFTVHDSIYVSAECDTIFVERIIERKIPIVHFEARQKWLDNILWILLALSILIILYQIFFKKK